MPPPHPEERRRRISKDDSTDPRRPILRGSLRSQVYAGCVHLPASLAPQDEVAVLDRDIGGTKVTASITNEAVGDLKLAKGMNASAIIKASDAIVGVA